LLLALGCAAVGMLGLLMKQRGAALAPPVEWRRPLRSTFALFSNRWWTIGVLVATAGWGFHVAGLALAPISLVQAVIAGGLVLLTPMADRLFGHSVSRREWIGVAVAAAGLALLALTLGHAGDSAHSAHSGGTLALYVGLLVGVCVAACFAVRGDPPQAGVVLAAAAGAIWGASDVTIKALSDQLDAVGAGVLLDPLAAVIAMLSLAGLIVSARSLQLGPAIPVIVITTTALNLVTIASGPIVFGEPLPSDTLALVVRLLAFVLVIFGAALTPGPRDGEPALA
jgi:drug/metabolite transporter (DMT)-like permease